MLVTNSSDGNGVQTVAIALAGTSNPVLGMLQRITRTPGRR